MEDGHAQIWLQEGLDEPDEMQGDQAERSALQTARHDEIRPKGLWSARRIRRRGPHGIAEAVAEVSSLGALLPLIAAGQIKFIDIEL